jgi:hypothetical protein
MSPFSFPLKPVSSSVTHCETEWFHRVKSVLWSILHDDRCHIFAPLLWWINVCSATVPAHGVRCYVPLLLETLKPSIWVFKFSAHLQCDFVSLLFYHMTIHDNIVDSSNAKPFEHFILHVTMFGTIYFHLFWNITPLYRACCSVESQFLYISTEWNVRFHKVLIFHLYFFLFIKFSNNFRFFSSCLSWLFCLLFTHISH